MKSIAIASMIKPIKILSTLLIGGAIALEGGNLILHYMDIPLPKLLGWIVVIERVALIAHFVEGIIAGILAQWQGKSFIKSSVYTFFVGTIGLLEILDRDSQNQ